MATIRAAKPEATYGVFFQAILKSCIPAEDVNAISVEIVYLENSVKEGGRKKRGDQSTRVYITGFFQRMPNVSRCRHLLHNNQNKTNLIEMFVKYPNCPEIS